jgi:beta-glucosidase
VPVTGISFAVIYPFTVTSVVSGGGNSEALSGHVTFLPVLYKSLGSSWTVSQVQDGPAIDLATTADGTWFSLDPSQPYGGPADLSGKVWLNWDSSNLYITADITDDVFSEPATGVNIWQGDSLQVAATSGVPGASATESTASVDGHYEYGAALTPDGPQMYRWIAPTEGSGQVTNATVNVTRDDTTNTTLYEIALPWSDLTSVQAAANTVFSFAAIVNDKDTGARKGFVQWGGGIGTSKDVAGFNMAQLMSATAS